MAKVVVGIDPGKRGAISVLRDNQVINTLLMPLKSKGEIDFTGIKNFLLKLDIDYVVLERQNIYPGQGNRSNQTTMRQYGVLIGILIALDIKYFEVNPTQWQKVCLVDLDEDTSNLNLPLPKKRSIYTVRTLFPNVNLLPTPRSKKPSDAISDSILIAMHKF